MPKSYRRRLWRAVVIAAHATLLQAACLDGFQREVEVLFATNANLYMIRDSVLVNWLGPGILQWW